MRECTAGAGAKRRRMRPAWTPPIGEWPVIRGGAVRRVPDVDATPALTASARWRFALRDDTYTDHRLRLLAGSRVRARLHVAAPPVARADAECASAVAQGSVVGDRRTVGVAPPLTVVRRADGAAQDTQQRDGTDVAVLHTPARALAEAIPAATQRELELPDAVLCACGPRRVRQRVVFVDARERPLLYASFWWDSRVFEWLGGERGGCAMGEGTDEGRAVVLPSALGLRCYEHSRMMLCVIYGSPQLMRPTWGREYVYKRRKKPFLVVQEVFAEGICRYLGPLTPPLL